MAKKTTLYFVVYSIFFIFSLHNTYAVSGMSILNNANDFVIPDLKLEPVLESKLDFIEDRDVILFCIQDQDLSFGSILPDYTFGVIAIADNDPNPVITQNPPIDAPFTDGMTVTLTATTVSGDRVSCSFTVNQIPDAKAPRVVCPLDQLLVLGSDLPDYTGLVNVIDNEDPNPVITQSPAIGAPFTDGVMITLTATDASGNSAGCTFIVNEIDTEDPKITCPLDQLLALGSVLPDYSGLASVTDNEDPNPVITQSPGAGTPFTDGMTITLTATDVSGNSTGCAFTVNEIDTESPEIICLEDQYFECGATVPDYTVQIAVTDNKDTNPIVIQSALIGTALIDGMEITINAIDESGNESECVFTVYQEIEIALETSTDVTITEGEEVVITAFGNVEGVYEWTPSESLSEANSSATTATPEETTTYTVLFTTKNDCVATAEVTVTVNALPEDETKYGFSPDNDGINEYWEIDRITEYPNNRVQIYNRWGNLVFEMNNYDNEDRVFNGTANRLQSLGANELPEGTYFFKIYIEGNHHFRKTEGFLLLKR